MELWKNSALTDCEYEKTVDCFCGGGGTSKGYEMAGIKVSYAINHDPDAIIMHQANHPFTEHFNENVWDLSPLEVTRGLPVACAWFSPDCTHFSRAKGGKPMENRRRGLAWVVIKWAREVKPRTIILENVPEFKTWGPVKKEKVPVDQWYLHNGKPRKYKIIEYPDPAKKGKTFNFWINRLRGLGYQVEWRELSACDYGAPTIRKRFFLIARCDGEKIVWPEPTHGPGRLPYRTAAECIDWSIPCPSIFDRKIPLAKATLNRIAKGIQKFVIDSGNPFIMKYYKGVVGSDLFNPMPTVTAIDHNALVVPLLTSYHGLKGNETRGQSVNEPMGTVDSSNRYGLVSAFLTKFFGTAVGSDMRLPMPTVTGQGQHVGEVRAFLVQYNGSSIGQEVTKPMHTVTSKDRLGLVTIAGQQYQIADIGLRMLTPRELARAQGLPEDYILTGSKSNQVAKIGNSVPPLVACALIKANVQLRKISQAKVG